MVAFVWQERTASRARRSRAPSRPEHIVAALRRQQRDLEHFIAERLEFGDAFPLLLAGRPRPAALGDRSTPARAQAAEEFLARPRPAVNWGVEGVLREHSLGGIFGIPAAFKAILGVQLGVDVARGTKWLGRFPTVAGPVLFAQEDMHPDDFQDLLAALLPDPRGVPFFVAPHRPALVFLDAFYVLHDTEGYSGKDLVPLLDRLRALRGDSGASVLFIDHNRKAPGTPARGKVDPIGLLYGGRAKSAAVDYLLHIERVRGTNQAVLSMPKQRGAASETVLLHWLATQGGGATRPDILAGTRLAHCTVKRILARSEAQGKVERLDRRANAVVWATPEVAAAFRQRHGAPVEGMETVPE